MNLGVWGKKGEDLTVGFLRKQGCLILKRNFTSRFGEIDIIAQKDNLLLFIEVKTRRCNPLVSGAEAVNAHKIKRLTLTAQDFLLKFDCSDCLQPRFDVAEVTVTEDTPPKFKLNYIKNAF